MISLLLTTLRRRVLGCDCEQLRRDLARAERRALHAEERAKKAELAVRAYEMFESKAEVRA